jgi:acetyl-CoA carboxylase carboxyl transferase subunit alpha
LKIQIIKALAELKTKTPDERVNDRIIKYGKMGFWEEFEEVEEEPVDTNS